MAAASVREQLRPDDTRLSDFFAAVASGALGATEGIALLTCSRTEFYVVGQDAAKAARSVQAWFLDGKQEYVQHTYVKTERRAVRHLCSVAGGLDSIMIGEHQILGQLRTALDRGREAGVVGPLMERFVERALHAGRRARNETSIGEGGTSLAFAAAETAANRFALEDRDTVLIIGAGQTGALAAHHFRKHEWPHLLIANRTYDRAVSVADMVGGEAVAMKDLASALERADVIVTAAGGSKPVLTRDMITALANQPKLVVDLGNPRNVDPEVGSLQNVALHDLDDLRSVSEESLSRRADEVPAARSIVEEEAAQFNAWLAHRAVVPLVKTLRESFAGIARQELEEHARHFDEGHREMLERYTRSLLNKLLHHPITQMKELAEEAQDPHHRIAAFGEIFGAAGWGEAAPVAEYEG